MPLEWVATMGGLAVGVAGIVGMYLTTRRQSVAQLQAQREERHQRRLEAAYPKLLSHTGEFESWRAELDFAIRHEPNLNSELLLPDLEENNESLPAVWSPHIQYLTMELVNTVQHLHFIVVELSERWEEWKEHRQNIAEATGYLAYLAGSYQRSNELLVELSAAVYSQVWKELRSEDDGHIEPEDFKVRYIHRGLVSSRPGGRGWFGRRTRS
jgi:hypothetical protein